MRWDHLAQDVRYSLRSFRRDSGFFAAAILLIGLGIGANTAIFSVVNAVLFRPPGFAHAERLVWIANDGKEGGLSSVTTKVGNYSDWKRENRSFEAMGAYFAFFDYGTYNLIGRGEPERLIGVGVSQDFLELLGIQPVLGRGFTDEEAKWNGPPAVLLTHGLWRRRFGADPGIVGQTITLNDKASTVAGVLPAGFDFATVFSPGARVDMLVPFPITPETDRWGNTLAVMGRLKPGVTVQQAQAEFDVMNRNLRLAHPERWAFGARLTPLQDHLTGRFRRGLLMLLWAVGAVLLVACTNLSNLILARSASRRKELAVRAALGASRARLIGQAVTEGLVLSGTGALLGTGLAWLGVRLLTGLRGVSIPLLGTVRIDGASLLFTAGAAALTGIVLGLVPAFAARGGGEFEPLKESGRGLSESKRAAWTRSALVASEVATAFVLVVGAGLLIRSFARLLEVDLGFRPEQAASWRIDTGERYTTPAQRTAFYERLVQAVEAVPGVESAGITDALPLSRDRTWAARARGAVYPPGQTPLAHPRLVDWRYLQTMRIPLVAGRFFSARDTAESEKAIIVNEKLAKRLWPNQDPVGQIVLMAGEQRVVGVVGNVRHQSLEEEGGLEAYMPITQVPSGSVELVVRTRLPLEALAGPLRAALRGVDATLPTAEYQKLGELVERAVSPRRFLMLLLGAFAAAALALASIGIYGVVSYSVSRRTAEIGVRMALGASPRQVRRQVIRETAGLVGCGVAAGIAGALALGRLMGSLLYRMEPADPVIYGLAVAALAGVALAAAYVPALRASRVDPMAALRTT